MKSIVYDAGALIALERRNPKMLALTQALIAHNASAHVPAGVLAQVWRGSSRQHPIGKLLKASAIRVHTLDHSVALRIGKLLGQSKTSDVIDAHVVLLARLLGATVITSDPDDIQKLDSSLRLRVI